MKALKKSGTFLKKWELALLLSLCISLCAGVWAQNEQRELASRLIRLHVVAGSDSESDQQFKLEVRDRMLEMITPMLSGISDPSEALQVIERSLPELESAAAGLARAQGKDCDVSAALGIESYPTRVYEGFSLPAGEYMSLRMTIGEGEGQNWWCVIFPPLCIASALETADASDMLTSGDIALITEENEGYVLKFRVLELWGELKNRFK